MPQTMSDMHLYNQYLLNINYVPDTILGTGDIAVNKNKAPVLRLKSRK